MQGGRERLIREIEDLARDVAARRGLEVVELVFRSQGKYSLLRIDVDRPGPIGVTLEDCEGLSRDLDPALDALPGLPETGYDLQVSSPGLERPIRSDDDFRRNTGRRVEVEMAPPFEGRSRFVGTLQAHSGESVTLALDDGGEVVLPRASIALARQDLGLPARRPEGGGSPGRRRRRGIV